MLWKYQPKDKSQKSRARKSQSYGAPAKLVVIFDAESLKFLSDLTFSLTLNIEVAGRRRQCNITKFLGATGANLDPSVPVMNVIDDLDIDDIQGF